MNNTKAYVVGENTHKSLSPLIFNYWFSKYKINAEYKYKEVKPKNFDNSVSKILTEEGVRGLNITNPYKEKIIPYLHKIDRDSKKIGAVNCVSISKSVFYGTNTDWIGYSEALKEKILQKTNKNKKAIVIGFGGAAKAVLFSLNKLGYQEIHIFNRTPEKIKNLQNKFFFPHPLADIYNHINSADIIINTTPTNVLRKLDNNKINHKIIASDIVYRPMETDFLKIFTKSKDKIYGISMLLHQAVPCFELWFGIKPTIDEELLRLVKGEII